MTTRIFEIYVKDLTPEAQKRLEKVIGNLNETNYAVFPLAVLEFEEEDDE